MKKQLAPIHSPIYEELEPRLLFSADVAEALAADAVEQDFDEEPIIIADLEAEAETSIITVDQPVEEEITVSTDPQAGEEVVADESETEQETSVQLKEETPTDTTLEETPAEKINIVTESETTTGEKSTEDELSATELSNQLVLVNDNVHDYELLVDDLLQSNDDDYTIEVVILDDEQNGIEQVSALLAERSDVNAIHIITHGSDGQFALGSDWLNNDDLLANSEAISSWSDTLSEDADILLYGCNIAIDGDGQILTDTLAELTGADVAASDDLTGSAALGGDWDLEYSSGQIEADSLMTDSSTGEWQGLLAGQLLESHEPALGSIDSLEVKSGVVWGQTFSYDSPDSTYDVSQIDIVIYKELATDAGQTITITLRDAFNGNILGSSATISSDSLANSAT